MDIGQLYEATAALRFASQKLQSGGNNEETAAIKEDLKARVLQILERISFFCEARQTESLEDLFDHFETVFDKYRLENVFDGQLEFVILFEGQRAHLFQALTQFEHLSASLGRLEALYLRLLNVPSDGSGVDFLSVPNLHFPGHRQIFGNRVLNLIKMALGLAQVYLQQTAVFSQMNEHAKALACAEKTAELAYRIVERIVQIFGYFRQFGVSTSETLEAFSGQINDFAIYFDYLSRSRATLKDVREPNKSNELLWRTNSDVTIKQLLQRIHSQKEPGAQLSLHRKLPCEDPASFHISTLVKLPNFLDSVKFLEQARFDERLLNRAALLLVSAIFSIATENRFISITEIDEGTAAAQAAPPEEKDKKAKCEVISKEYKLRANKRFIQSERIHLLVLDLLWFGYPDTSKLAAHFFQSFKKNYSLNIFTIEEEDEASFSTVKTSLLAEVNQDLSPTNSGMRYIKISLNKQNFNDFKKRPKPEVQNNESLDLHSPGLQVVASMPSLPPSNNTTQSGWSASANGKEGAKTNRSRGKEGDGSSVPNVSGGPGGAGNAFATVTTVGQGAVIRKGLPMSTNPTREQDFASLQLSSVDRFRTGWSAFDTQKKQFPRPNDYNFAKKSKVDGYMNFLAKQKGDFISQLKSAKNFDPVTRTVDKNYNMKMAQTVRGKEPSAKRRPKSKDRNRSSSSDFLQSEQVIPSVQMESRHSIKKGEVTPGVSSRKNVDRLGFMTSKFTNIINESSKDFRAKYEEKIKEKVAGHMSGLPGKLGPNS